MTWEPPPDSAVAPVWLVGVVVVALAVGAALGAQVWHDRPARVTTAPDDAPTLGPGGTPPRPDRADFTVHRLARAPVASHRIDLPAAIGRHTLVVAEGLALQLVDLRSGQVRTIDMTAAASGPLTGAMSAVGDSVLADTARGVLRLTDDPTRMHLLVADHRPVPTSDDHSLWVSDNVSTPLGGTVTRITLDGEVRDRITLPATTRPLAGNGDRVVVGGPGVVAAIDVHGDRRVVAQGDPIASDGDRIAWADCTRRPRCAIVVGTVADPDRVRTNMAAADLPSAVFGGPLGVFSPDGRLLAVPLTPTPGRVADAPPSRVLILDTTTGTEARRLPGRHDGRLPLAWSPDSRWLATTVAGGIALWDSAQDRVHTLHVGSGRRVRGLTFR